MRFLLAVPVSAAAKRASGHRGVLFCAAIVLLSLLAACGAGAYKTTVLFVSARPSQLGVYSASVDNGVLTALSGQEDYAYQPRWSPDYTKLLFLARRGQKSALVVENRDGSQPKTVVESAGVIANPRWAPDGKHIAYGLTVNSATSIHVIGVDGQHDTTVAFDTPPEDSPSWSPDSQWLVAASAASDSPGIYERNPTGVNYHRLSAGLDTQPLWSPKGDRIAFLSQRDGTPEVYLMLRDGSHPTRLTNNTAKEYDLAWSPDGTRLAFVSEQDGNPEVYVAKTDGSKPVRLTYNAFRDLAPAWSPDGLFIIFVSYRDNNADLFVMDADGNHQRNLTSSPFDDFMPAWSAK